MAQIIGSVCMSHIPMIGMAINRGLQQEPYFKPFFDGFAPVHRWLKQNRPDVAVIFYNDHGLNFFLDKMPTFAVGAAPEYQNADEGWGLKTFEPLPSAKRCLALGRAVGRAIEAYEKDLKVVVLGTGGLSHQLDGRRAGYINRGFDHLCLDRLIDDPDALTRYSNVELVDLAGMQSIELLNWIAARGTLLGSVKELRRTG